MEKPVLVIGCGSDLRGDDAVGLRVVETVAGWNLDGVQALAVHQLTPEWAEVLSVVQTAIFVDADVTVRQVRCAPLQPCESPGSLSHIGGPCTLLALAQSVYGRSPIAWEVAIPAMDFRLGVALSSVAQHGLEEAVTMLRQILEGAPSGWLR